MHIVIEEAKKFTVVDYFVAFWCEVFSIIELLEVVVNVWGWITTSSREIEIGGNIGGGDGSLLGV